MEKDLTPIILVDAEKSLETGNFDKAIELCKRSIEYFPDYYLGYVILIESYESIGDYEEANKIFQTASIKFANNLFFRQIARRRDKYGSLINSKNQDANKPNQITIHTEQIENFPTIEDDFIDFPGFSQFKDINLEELSANDIDLIPGFYLYPFKIQNYTPKITDLQLFYDQISKDIPNIESYLDKPIENYKIENNVAIEQLEIDENSQELNSHIIMPTETLAEIYIRQKKIPEAITMYEQLIKMHPDKYEYYSERIAQLKNETD
ncbi:MAG TPA: tetratricopeptide repeat protein [Candidatus Kapabacteria bacterium]|nr:tetratricopeptide repeat protein [Candidatus Kapabacteria bacterium]HOV92093.1 tetratricopeptide repeat protein [Candidatus Kapabacteria bacterium]